MKGSTSHDTTEKHGLQVSDAPPLTASESSNPCRYKLSYMERVRFQKAASRRKKDRNSKWSTCSREDGWWGQGSDRAHQQSLSPHEGRPQSSQTTPEQQIGGKKKKKKRWSPVFCWCWIGCYCPRAERVLVPIIRQPGCPQRQSRPGISSAFQAQITRANPFLQHWLMTEVGCSLPIGW